MEFHPLFPLNERALNFFSVLGRALYTAQHLEMNCRAVVGYIHMRLGVIRSGNEVLDSPEFLGQIDHIWKKTLGQNIKYLKDNNFIETGLLRILEEATEARNEIVHSITIGINDQSDCESVNIFDDIKPLVGKIATADKMISALLRYLNKDLLPTPNYFLTYENRVIDWVMAPASYH